MKNSSMRPGNNEYTIALVETEEQLLSFSKQVRPLPGISGDAARKRLARLIVEIMTNEGLFISADHSASTVVIADSHQKTFDPQAAARILFSENQAEEACWLIFLSVYVGKQPGEDSELFRNIYNGLSSGHEWTWQRMTGNTQAFKSWLLENQPALKSKGYFGPLHKFPYLDQKKVNLIADEIIGYAEWIKREGGHYMLFNKAENFVKNDPAACFDFLYTTINRHTNINRSISFKLLATFGRMNFVYAHPGHPYLADYLAAKKGARKLFGGHKNIKIKVTELDAIVMLLAAWLKLDFGAEIMREALSRWETIPGK